MYSGNTASGIVVKNNIFEDNKTGDFAGQYVFASEEDAVGYGNSAAQKLVKSLCKPGSYTWRVTNIQQ